MKAKPSSCSPKYWTMSLRSDSPCTSTSRPSSSCKRDDVGDLGLQAGSYSASSMLAGGPGARRADLGGLRERPDGGGRQRRQVKWPSCGLAGARVRAGATLAGRAVTSAHASAGRLAIVHPGRLAPRRARSVAIVGELVGDGVAAVVEPLCRAGDLVDLWVANASQLRSSRPGRSRARGRAGTCSSEHDGATSSRSGPRRRRPASSRASAALQVGAPDVAAVDDPERQRQRSGAPLRAASSWSGSARDPGADRVDREGQGRWASCRRRPAK